MIVIVEHLCRSPVVASPCHDLAQIADAGCHFDVKEFRSLTRNPIGRVNGMTYDSCGIGNSCRHQSIMRCVTKGSGVTKANAMTSRTRLAPEDGKWMWSTMVKLLEFGSFLTLKPSTLETHLPHLCQQPSSDFIQLRERTSAKGAFVLRCLLPVP